MVQIRYAYAAAVFAILSAIPSIYWGLGGTIGLHTIGGQIEEAARAHSPTIFIIVWIAVLLKLLGAAWALALTRTWSRTKLVLLASWGASSFLTIYGGVLVLAGAAAVSGLIHVTGDMYALKWHLYCWDPIFLVWGVLLGLATYSFQRRSNEV